MKQLLPMLAALTISSSVAALEPEEFAHGLELTSDGSLVEFELPARVLTSALDPELGDVCLFDARGQQVAHALARSAPAVEARSFERELRTFYALEAVSRERTGDVEVTVERDPTGAIRRAYTRPIVTTSTRVAGYLLDLSALGEQGALDQITLQLASPVPYQLSALLESSDDLTTFAPLSTATFARLERDGELFERTSVEFAPLAHKFVRLTLLDPPSALTLTGVRVRVRAPPAEAPLRELALPGKRVEGARGQLFAYELPPAIRALRYGLALPDDTAIVESTLLSGGAQTPFVERDRAIFRRGEDTMRSLAEPLRGSVRIEVGERGGGVRGGSPTLRVAYTAPRALFSGGSRGPYLLAFGSAKARCSAFDEAALRGDNESTRPAPARLGRERVLGGERALRPLEQGPAPRLLALWGVLLVAVVVLAVVALKLARRT